MHQISSTGDLCVSFKNPPASAASEGHCPNCEASLKLQVQPGEAFSFKIDVLAGEENLQDLGLEYSAFTAENHSTIPADAFTCINLDKIDTYGNMRKMALHVNNNAVQSLWIGVQIPKTAQPGLYTGQIKVITKNYGDKTVDVSLIVSEGNLDDFEKNINQLSSHVHWFNSTRGNDTTVTKPYTPLKAEGDTLRFLGRKLLINKLGLPQQVTSLFSKSVDEISRSGRDILAGPIGFSVRSQGCASDWQAPELEYTNASDNQITWRSYSVNNHLSLECSGSLDYDGYISYKIILTSSSDSILDDVTLDIPFNRDVAKYAMGLGMKGGTIPEQFAWQWDPSTQQDSIWIGDVNAGIQVKLKGANYVKPFVNIYFKYRPLHMPEGWYNEGKGRVGISTDPFDIIRLRASSGKLDLKAGKAIEFNFDLLVTPLKPIDMKKHWHTRYYHNNEYNDGNYGNWITNADKAGANVINLHHGSDLYPFINYPFYDAEAIKAFVDEAHKKDIKTKLYYTVREISDRMHELPAIRSLGGEILPNPEGQEPSFLWQDEALHWVREHLGEDVIPAWRHTFKKGKYAGQIDAAVLSDGTSRMCNYYIEGLHWLLCNLDIDGIYVDDTDYDRNTMRRARKVLDEAKEGGLIDFHSWNHMNPRAGMVSSTTLYMSLFPYLDSLWFGEGFDYNSPPEYWLTEISGIPFGLTSQMLKGGGNPWRGMLFGMTNRLGWGGKSPEHLWNLWDEFGIQDSKMLGFWDERCPVGTDNKNIYATVYKKADQIMVALASWADTEVECKLEVCWKDAGLSPDRIKIHSPYIPDFQEGCIYNTLDTPFHIAPGKGLILLLQGN